MPVDGANGAAPPAIAPHPRTRSRKGWPIMGASRSHSRVDDGVRRRGVYGEAVANHNYPPIWRGAVPTPGVPRTRPVFDTETGSKSNFILVCFIFGFVRLFVWLGSVGNAQPRLGVLKYNCFFCDVK